MIRRALCCLVPTLCLAWGAAAVAQNTSQKKVYRWIDEHGQVHYGNTVPPEYSRRDREIMNKHGVPVRKIEGDVTDAEARDQAETERRLKEAALRRQRDNVLLQTYLSVGEIEMLRDRRTDILDSQIAVQVQYIEGLEQKLTKLLVQAKNFAPRNTLPGAKPMPENLDEDIKRTGLDIRTANVNLDNKKAERKALVDRFTADIARFKELKGIKDPAPASKAATPAGPATKSATP
jgi:Domain of unknown function (DUF4124)